MPAVVLPLKGNAIVCMCGWKVEGVPVKEDAVKQFNAHVCPRPRVGLEREGWDIPPDAA